MNLALHAMMRTFENQFIPGTVLSPRVILYLRTARLRMVLVPGGLKLFVFGDRI